MQAASVCFVGLGNLPVLSAHYGQHGVGGEEVQQTLLARALARRGYEVSTIVSDLGQPEGIEIDGIRVHKAYAQDAGIPGLRFFHPRLSGLWSAMRRADAAVYYVSCAGVNVGFVAHFVRSSARRMVFRVAHDTDCDPRRVMVPYWRDRKIYEYGLRRADVVLAQSDQQAGAMRRNYGIDSTVAGMLVEPQVRDLSFDERDIDVLWVNNIRRFKRPELAIELARRLPRLRVHMVGGPLPGFADLYDQLQKEASGVPNLRFHGRVPYHEVNGLYERARVFVNTSDSEGFPNSYLQSWRRGVPVVAFFDPDGLIRRHGLGAAATSPESMATEVMSYCNSRERWRACGQTCRRFMDDRYGDSQVLEAYLAAIAGGGRGEPPLELPGAWSRD